MTVTQISPGRFHHFHLARQLEKHALLEAIYTGYPMFKLKDEEGIPKDKIKTFPWIQAPYMFRGRIGLNKFEWLNKEWEWAGQQALDKYVATQISTPTVLVALSGSGLNAGRKSKRIGGKYICDRGSSHIRFQNEILTEEYKRWGFEFKGVDPRIIEKEEREYETADIITVPSEFVRSSFLKMGVNKDKIRKVMYGARLGRFYKSGAPNPNKFTVLWVGGISIRKGFIYLLEAFNKFTHPGKELVVVGALSPEIKSLIAGRDLSKVTFLGQISNSELPKLYSSSHVFVLPSLEEGLAMVQGEALACGCPVIASCNTGAEDLLTESIEGFIVPIRSSDAILEKLQILADDPLKQKEMSSAAIERVKKLGGWDSYGNQFVNVVNGLLN